MKIQPLTTLALTLLLSACADGNWKPSVGDNQFGEATRAMVRAQIANPHAAENPAPDSPRVMDGYAGVGVVDGFRQGFTRNVQQNQGVTVNIGSSSSGGGQ